MKLANMRYLEMTAAIVGEEVAQQVPVVLLGALLQRLLNGRTTSLEAVEAWGQEAISAELQRTGKKK